MVEPLMLQFNKLALGLFGAKIRGENNFIIFYFFREEGIEKRKVSVAVSLSGCWLNQNETSSLPLSFHTIEQKVKVQWEVISWTNKSKISWIHLWKLMTGATSDPQSESARLHGWSRVCCLPSESMLLRAVGGMMETLHWPRGHLRGYKSMQAVCT